MSRWSGSKWFERADHWFRTSPTVDWFYLGGVVAVLLLSAYILAAG